MPDVSMRCFVAVPLPDPLRREIAAFAAECAAVPQPGIKTIASPNYHLTLKFLGETKESAIDEICEALSSIRFAGFPLVVRGAGFFEGSGLSPRVLWAGTDPNEELSRLRSLVEEAVVQHGFQRDQRLFVPHITIGRAKEREGDLLKSFMDANSGRYFGEFIADRFSLYISDLSGKEPVYTSVRDFSLYSKSL